MQPTANRRTFHLVLIKPTHYDDDGYPLQWLRSAIPANTLACVHSLAEEARSRNVLGPETEITIHDIDETNTRVRPNRIARMIRRDGGFGLIALVGVQSNQFPRAVDIAESFLAAGLPVCLGGFHVSGCLAMLDEMPAEMREAQEMGVSFFAGEAEEGRLDEVIRDAAAGRLKPLYNWIDKLPSLNGSPTPFLEAAQVKRTHGAYSSFDLGRGCPFQCSFCTIINVQGRVSRFRSADDLEAIVRANAAIGIQKFFLTDDNLARNRNWEPCFDRLIELREREGLKVRLQVQVDTLCHRIPGFIDKAVKAGVDQVFIGMENINPDNLLAAKKKQNRIGEYREMLLAWKKHAVVITAGYIIGFPNDTRESILHDVDVIKRELPIDIIFFTNLTPLPGCEDHKKLLKAGVWMDPDLNKYDLNQRVTHHSRMSDEEWDRAYREAWERFYTFEHMETILKRMAALGSNKKLTTLNRLVAYRDFVRLHGVHPLEGGILRMKWRRDRRPTLKRETPFAFYPKYAAELARGAGGMVATYVRLRLILRRVWGAADRHDYRDLALTAPSGADETLALFSETRGGMAAVTKDKAQKARIAAAQGRREASEVALLEAAE
jgi:Radical SAM superfamily